MTAFISPQWSLPSYNPIFIPDLTSLDLTDKERALINRLNMLSYRQRANMLIGEAYYRGEQQLTNLGIALPPELNGLRVVLGWARMAVDPYVERLALDSWRVSNLLEPDAPLTEVMELNNWPALENLAYTDALALGRSWFTLSQPDEDDDDLDAAGAPKICVESPLNMSASFDVRTGKPTAVLQSYWQDEHRCGVLYLPEQTIFVAEDEEGQWQLVERDQHNFGFVPCVRMTNRPRANNRSGASEITNELMSVTDAALRVLLNLTAASEFYSVPQKLILGATEEDFLASDGVTRKTSWETYIGRVLALQRDAEGALPEVKTFEAYDPSVFTKLIEMYAAQAAGIIGATPQELGLYTDGNPISSEALQVAEARRDRRTARIQADFTCGVVEVGKMAVRMQNNGALPEKYRKLTADWRSPQAVNFTGYSDGIAKLMQEGAIARGSEVALRKLGFTAVDRRQIKDEIAKDPVRAILTELGTSIEGKTDRLAAALIAAGQPDQAAGALVQAHQAQLTGDQQRQQMADQAVADKNAAAAKQAQAAKAKAAPK